MGSVLKTSAEWVQTQTLKRQFQCNMEKFLRYCSRMLLEAIKMEIYLICSFIGCTSFDGQWILEGKMLELSTEE